MAVLAARFFLKEDSLGKLTGNNVYVVSPEIDMQRYFTILKAEPDSKNSKQMIIKVKEDLTKNEDGLVGKSLLIDEDAAKNVFDEVSRAEDELIGLEVVDENGTSFGKVEDVSGSSAQKHLVVSYEGKELLIPLVDEIVKSQSDKKILVDLPEGLIDLNEA